MTRQPRQSDRSASGRLALIAASIAIGVFIPLALAEAALRFLPVCGVPMAEPVNEANPIFHFTPNRTVTWSRGWDFSVVNRFRVNNSGYVNNQDYDAADPRPLFSVVGDSYIEAAIVPYAETLHGRLAQLVNPRGRVYSFAASGAPLSQYLVWAKEARVRWKAKALAIVVVGNDFDQSLAAYKEGRGFHHYVEDGAGELTLRRFDHEPGWLRAVVSRSALVRYVVLNLEAIHRTRKLLDKGKRRLLSKAAALDMAAYAEDFVGNTRAKVGQRRLKESEAAVRAFLRDMVTFAGWEPGQVVFVVDGIRYPSKKRAVLESYFVKMRTYFMAKAREEGFEVIDMDEHFFAHHPTDGKSFEFEGDAHWNGFAHRIAADAVARSDVFSRWRQGLKDGPLDRGALGASH